jgi:ribonuclease D
VIIDLVEQKMAGSEIAAAMARAIEPPEFELIDLQNDPDELRNLADNPEYAPTLEKLKKRIQAWQEETSDPLRIPANLKLMSDWHDKLTSTLEPEDERGRPPFIQRDYVGPRYKELMDKLEE